MKPRSNNQLPNNLPQLQNLIKRDPESYRDEFRTQYNHFSSLVDLHRMQPKDYNEDFDNLIMFLAQVSSYYPNDAKSYPQELISILRQYSTVLDPAIRMTLCRAIVLMRNKGLLMPADFLSLFFELLRCQDKALRKFLQAQITTDIKNTNAKHKNIRLNTELQNFMFNMLKDSHETAAKMSLDVMIELYRKNVWKDAKTVNVIATGCFSKFNKIVVAALSFFLGSDPDNEKDGNEESSESENEKQTVKDVMLAMKVNKKSRRRKKILKKTKHALSKTKKKSSTVFDFSAIHLLHDPQELAEKLYKKLDTLKERFEMKMLMMNFLSRLIGAHKLMLLNFYPLLLRYLQPHQRDVTRMLMFAAQAAHEQVSPDVIGPVVRGIADNFISDRNSPEVMTVGLNAIREICMRCPFAIEPTLLQDLVEYKSYKNKNVSMAAKSIIQLFRNINPQLLVKRLRGRPTESTEEIKPLNFGEIDAKSYIPGAEMLPEAPIDEKEKGKKEPQKKYDSDSDESDGWVDIGNPSDNEMESDAESASSEQEDSIPEACSTEVGGPEQSTETKKRTLKAAERVKEKREKATTVSVGRILSQEEFKKVKIAQLVKKVQAAGKKRQRVVEEEEFDRKELVSLRAIEKLHKKPKCDKQERLDSMKEGQEGREKFGRKFTKSSSNKQKRKNKAFGMIKHKVRAKTKRSFREKQISLRKALLKKKRMI